jgi:hypothetical protein
MKTLLRQSALVLCLVAFVAALITPANAARIRIPVLYTTVIKPATSAW